MDEVHLKPNIFKRLKKKTFSELLSRIPRLFKIFELEKIKWKKLQQVYKQLKYKSYGKAEKNSLDLEYSQKFDMLEIPEGFCNGFFCFSDCFNYVRKVCSTTIDKKTKNYKIILNINQIVNK